MIAPHELRKGNLFHPIPRHIEIQMPATGVIFKVQEIKTFTVSAILHDENPAQVEKFEEFKYFDMSPADLSPELLERAGFKKDSNGWFLPKTQFSLTDQFYPCWFDRMLWPQDIEDFKHLSLKYLHELQNLYFALTNSELQIDL
jgi:hypothetical protein